MPCDIGYRSYERVTIPVPEPQTFTEKSEAPEVDADLLEKLGVEDPEFLEWVKELDTNPLLQEALKRTLAKLNTGGIDFKITADGKLLAEGRYITSSEKKRLSDVSRSVSQRWQFEIVGIVTELLDFSFTITQKGNTLILEAEEKGKTHPCDYIKITRTGEDAEITFEHYKSRKAIDLANAKFRVLADKLGVKITGGKREVKEGDPFPNEIRHDHSHSHGHGHGHKQ